MQKTRSYRVIFINNITYFDIICIFSAFAIISSCPTILQNVGYDEAKGGHVFCAHAKQCGDALITIDYS